MDLRRKLAYLHTAFAAFAVLAASATIYGVRLHVKNATDNFQRVIDQSKLIDHIRVTSKDQLLALYGIADGRDTINPAFLAKRDAYFTQLKEITRFGVKDDDHEKSSHLTQLVTRLQSDYDHVLMLISQGDYTRAKHHVIEQIEANSLASLDTQLQSLKSSMEQDRQTSIKRVLQTNNQLLGLAALVTVSCAGLVIIGGYLVRRWLIIPITRLQAATHEFTQGNLDHRVRLTSSDELGTLGSAMNTMAFSLRESERKYRSLFENLRDAILICDESSKIVECHDDDTQLLNLHSQEILGQSLLEAYPEWKSSSWEWEKVIHRITRDGQYVRASDMALQNGKSSEVIVDVVAYPIEYQGHRYAAIVLRNVTERKRMQRLVQRAETVESAATFARGIAHDFKNLLHSAVTSLSLMGQSSASSEKNPQRIQTALNACEQAASLSRRLLNFASSDEGYPELLELNEIVQLILGSLDEELLSSIRVNMNSHTSAMIKIDRDQLTQIILNLIHNACEAMPSGGDLNVKTEITEATDPFHPSQKSNYILFTLSDTGVGMTPEVKEHLFEPLFSTKDRGDSGIRGLGLAVVYAAVRHAGGFIQVDSQPNEGTTFHVYLPQQTM